MHQSKRYLLVPLFLTCLLFAAVLIWSISPAQASDLIDVPAGDSDALMATIVTANQSLDTTVIRLDNSADYHFDLSINAPDPIAGHVVLIGAGASLVGEGLGEIMDTH